MWLYVHGAHVCKYTGRPGERATQHGSWGPNVGPLKEQYTLFTSEPSLQAQLSKFYTKRKILEVYLTLLISTLETQFYLYSTNKSPFFIIIIIILLK